MYNLLIVDDEKSIVESIANDLPWEELNISRVFTACSGKQALEIIEQKRICRSWTASIWPNTSTAGFSTQKSFL